METGENNSFVCQSDKFNIALASSYHLSIQNYEELHTWSVQNIAGFWHSFWDYSKIIHIGSIESIIDDANKMLGIITFDDIIEVIEEEATSISE